MLNFEAQTTSAQKQYVTLTTILDNLGDEERWTSIMQEALSELQKRHPEIHIEIAYNQFQHPNERTEFLKAMTNNTPVDLMSVDQIWLEKDY